ncbi:MAG: D-glycero-beta-D-manno-heptose 1-phosphate adenylyltransferase [Bacillota bacterium]
MYDFSRTLSFLSNFTKRCKILLLGDVMLDRYYFGDVNRISQEAPVPVNRVREQRDTLGGAANLAHNLSLLGCDCFLGGVAGDDESQRILRRILAEKGIDGKGVLTTARPTTTKLRVVGSHQQMIRMDFEQDEPIGSEDEKKLQKWINAVLDKGVHGAALSDYAKGACTPALCIHLIGKCRERKIPVLVDPKGSVWEKYRGASYITPNMAELGDCFRTKIPNEDAAVEEFASKAREQFQIENVVVTRSEKGLSLINGGGVLHIPTRAQEVFDVSGAGDTIASILILSEAWGLSPPDAAHLANLAAGIEVGKFGTYAISRMELIDAMRGAKVDFGYNKKIMTLAEASAIIREWQSRGQKVVFTNGCFDLMHAGHVNYLEKAGRLGGKLVVGLNSDDSVRRLKGPSRPIITEKDRAYLLAALECVDGVVVFGEDTPAELIRALKPDVLVKGGDYRPDNVVGRDDVERLEIIPFIEGYSSTSIIEKIVDAHKKEKK